MAEAPVVPETAPVEGLSETDRLMYEHMTPFDAETLLLRYPMLAIDKPQLVELRDSRDYYLTECSGLFVEGVKAVATEDIKKLERLAEFATRSVTEEQQWKAIVEMAYKQGLAKPSIALLGWLNDRNILFFIASLAEDVHNSPHRSVHYWFYKQKKKHAKKLKAQAALLALEAAPESEKS